MRKDTLLTALILLGLVAGALVGQFVLYDPDATREALAQSTAGLQTAGDLIFIRPLRMLIIPLVFVSVVSGVCALGEPSKLGLVGGATLLYFAGTTLVAVTLGLAIATAVQPGAGIDISLLENTARQGFAEENVAAKVQSGPGGLGDAFLALVEGMVPSNILKAAVDGNILAIVLFAIFLGVALTLAGKAAQPAVAVIEAFLAGFMKIVGWIMWLAPIGVFLIIAARVGQTGLSNLVGPLGMYILCVVGGLLIQGAVVLPLVLWVFGRTNPYRFLLQMRKVILTAFSTASSSATLPVTIEECRRVGGCSKRAATFVPALGATVNMNGTALYEAVAVLFLFQAFGIELTMAQQMVILVTATLAAVGAPGIPGAGIVTMAIVINAVNSSLTAIAPDSPQLPLWTIGLILGVDRFLDMCRTTLNVFGDCVGARLITRIAPDEPGDTTPMLA
ncbi:MAG: dicarboxylate/amino acid:cation symporter [Phycisphaerales bacterium]|nr:dicarboxylate/amino acid:cation symporter [Phycisphaerales bacterium]